MPIVLILYVVERSMALELLESGEITTVIVL
jgi:hypothetical protein